MDSGDGPQLHVKTPLIESTQLSHIAGYRVFLKLENTQPTGTFKIRGVSHHMKKAHARGCERMVISSGGNAGFAAAYAARKLGIPLTLYVPRRTPQFAVDRLKLEGVDVSVHGEVWDHANEKAKEEAKKPGVGYIHPFDHPEVWEGHRSLIRELAEDMDSPPDLLIVSVGGGGLLVGIVDGMEEVGWHEIPILAMETEGANSFSEATKAGHLVTLPDIASIATCLGALTVCQGVLDRYKQRKIIPELVSDKQAVEAIDRFLDDHRMLVEPACSVSLAAVYNPIVQRLQAEGKLGPVKSAVVIVCGGGCVNRVLLDEWKTKLNVS